jgi:SAM-dependent methyltransferase
VFERLGLGPASTVLDIGCGCGGLGLALRERFGVTAYTGVEINRQAAQAAREVNPGGRFLHADILAVPPRELSEGEFDMVVSLGCIDWNVQFAEMLARSYAYVKPGGRFVSSFRVTPGRSLTDMRESYQYINFEGRKSGEVAPYVVLNTGELLKQLKAFAPARISGYGYWGTPSATAVTPLPKVGFVVIAVQKPHAAGGTTAVELDLPADLLASTT